MGKSRQVNVEQPSRVGYSRSFGVERDILDVPTVRRGFELSRRLGHSEITQTGTRRAISGQRAHRRSDGADRSVEVHTDQR